MFQRLLVAMALAITVAPATTLTAIDPVALNRASPNLIAGTDALSSKSTLVSFPTTSAVSLSTAETHELPADAIASLREVYVWAWPLIYMSNLKQSMELVRSAGHSGGAPVAPVNQLCMLTQAIDPSFQSVPCPNPDVLYGFGMMDLTLEPVIVQVPEFGNRYWLYQIGDQRMESMGNVGSMYATPAGFIMVVGPDWQGTAPAPVTQVIRSRTNLAYILPRVLITHDQSVQEEQLQTALSRITMYPLSKFTGQMKRKDWDSVRWYPAIGRSTRERSKLVHPERFFSDLGRVLGELTATEAEQPLAELASDILAWAEVHPSRQAWLQQLAAQLETDTIQPMFDFNFSGQALQGNWISLRNGAAFGDDYWARTATAKSNPFVNREREAKYYYLERSQDGSPLRGGQSYQLHFEAHQLPPAEGFWSVTLYNELHQFHANSTGRYSIGNTQSLKYNRDGSLTILIQSSEPEHADSLNWLPAPMTDGFKLYLRLYQPQAAALAGQWTPPAVTR